MQFYELKEQQQENNSAHLLNNRERGAAQHLLHSLTGRWSPSRVCYNTTEMNVDTDGGQKRGFQIRTCMWVFLCSSPVLICVSEFVRFEVWNIKEAVSDTAFPPTALVWNDPLCCSRVGRQRGGAVWGVWLWGGFLTLRLIKSRPRPRGEAGADTVWRLRSAVK